MLTERRKADRETMARCIYDNWIAAPGFSAEWIPPAPTYPGERCIRLDLRAPRGVCLGLNFNGKSWQPDTYVLPWYMESDSEARFAWSFGAVINPYHRRKATDIAEGFEALRHLICERMSQIQRGDAFEEFTP